MKLSKLLPSLMCLLFFWVASVTIQNRRRRGNRAVGIERPASFKVNVGADSQGKSAVGTRPNRDVAGITMRKSALNKLPSHKGGVRCLRFLTNGDSSVKEKLVGGAGANKGRFLRALQWITLGLLVY